MDYLPLTIPLIGIIFGHLLGNKIKFSDESATLLRYYSIGIVLTSTAFNFLPDMRYGNKRIDKPLITTIVLTSVILLLIFKEKVKSDINHYFIYNLFDIFGTGFVIGTAYMFHHANLPLTLISLTIATFFAGLTNVNDLIKDKYSKKEIIKIIAFHLLTYFAGIIVAYMVKSSHYSRLFISGIVMTVIYWFMLKKIFMWKDKDDYGYSLSLIFIGTLTMVIIR